MKATKLALSGLATAFALAACGGPPSNADAQKAVVALLEQSGAGQIADVSEFQLNGCVEAKEVAGTAATRAARLPSTLADGGCRFPSARTCAT